MTLYVGSLQRIGQSRDNEEEYGSITKCISLTKLTNLFFRILKTLTWEKMSDLEGAAVWKGSRVCLCPDGG